MSVLVLELRFGDDDDGDAVAVAAAVVDWTGADRNRSTGTWPPVAAEATGSTVPTCTIRQLQTNTGRHLFELNGCQIGGVVAANALMLL